MRDWPAYKWAGVALMAVGCVHIVIGLVLLTR